MSLYFTKEEARELQKELKEVYFTTDVGFLKAHNGLRRGNLHMVLGTTGGGKSTLIRSLINDFICIARNNNFGMGLWLSEETIKSYKTQLSCGVYMVDELARVQAFSEMDLDENDNDSSFFEWVEITKPDILILDNITTSRFYEGQSPSAQFSFATKLKNMAARLNIAVVIVAHTDAKTKDSQKDLIGVENIRGNRSISNLVEFAYIIQKITTCDPAGNTFIHNVVRVTKDRSHGSADKVYKLRYEPRMRMFTDYEEIPFLKFKEVWDARNKL
jgi:predicted ATP-dependent serine protease